MDTINYKRPCAMYDLVVRVATQPYTALLWDLADTLKVRFSKTIQHITLKFSQASQSLPIALLSYKFVASFVIYACKHVNMPIEMQMKGKDKIFNTVYCLLGDPGADIWVRRKSKRARLHWRAKLTCFHFLLTQLAAPGSLRIRLLAPFFPLNN